MVIEMNVWKDLPTSRARIWWWPAVQTTPWPSQRVTEKRPAASAWTEAGLSCWLRSGQRPSSRKTIRLWGWKPWPRRRSSAPGINSDWLTSVRCMAGEPVAVDDTEDVEVVTVELSKFPPACEPEGITLSMAASKRRRVIPKSRREPMTQSKNSIRPGRSNHQRTRSTRLKCSSRRRRGGCEARDVFTLELALQEDPSTGSSRDLDCEGCDPLNTSCWMPGAVSISSIGTGACVSEGVDASSGASLSSRRRERELAGVDVSGRGAWTGGGIVSISSMCPRRRVERACCRLVRGGAVGVSAMISESEERLLAAS